MYKRFDDMALSITKLSRRSPIATVACSCTNQSFPNRISLSETKASPTMHNLSFSKIHSLKLFQYKQAFHFTIYYRITFS